MNPKANENLSVAIPLGEVPHRMLVYSRKPATVHMKYINAIRAARLSNPSGEKSGALKVAICFMVVNMRFMRAFPP
jgi:hypothetical protein